MAKDHSATTDASAVGKITQVTGDATVVHTDGSHVKAEIGVPVHQGDVIETSAKGSVQMLFADNTTFAVSESAKLSIDQYVYNPQEHSGKSFFSMLQGVFVYTSGLIGKDDPGEVNIETPAGSIGIRGTVVAGNIHPDGTGTITIVDGAIVVTNGGGSLTLSESYDTATLNGYSTAPVDSGTMSPQTFDTTYSSAGAAPYSAGGTGETPTPPDAPVTTAPEGPVTAPDAPTPDLKAPDGMTLTEPPTGDAPVVTADAGVATTDVITVEVKDAWDPTVTDPASQPDAPAMTPPADTTFTTDTTGFGPPAPGSTFTDPAATTAGTPPPATGGTLAGTSPPPPTGTTGGGTGTTPTGTGTGGTAPPPQSAVFNFTPIYTHGTTNPADDGLSVKDMGWLAATPQNPIEIGFIQLQNISSPVFTYSTGTTINGTTLAYLSPTTTSAITVGGQPVMHFDASGHLFLDDPLAVLTALNNPSFNFNFTVTDTVTGAVFAPPTVVVQLQSPVLGPINNYVIGDHTNMTNTNILDPGNNAAPDVLAGNNGANDLIWGRNGGDIIDGGTTGNDYLFGGNGADLLRCQVNNQAKMFGLDGNDKLVIFGNGFLSPGFSMADGGSGFDILQLGNPSLPGSNFNFELANNIFNVEKIEIAQGISIGNSVTLSLQDVFDMTEAGSQHILNISNLGAGGFLSSVTVDTAGWNIGPTTLGTVAAGAPPVTINATFGAESVTLIINTGPNTGDGIGVTIQ